METKMKNYFKYFGRGLLFLIPAGATVYVVFWVFTTIGGTVWRAIANDSQSPWGYAVGLIVTAAFIFVVGVFTSMFIARPLMALIEKIFNKIPLINLLYSSIKDMAGAFLGEQKKFDTPVMVEIIPGQARVLGFITRKSMDILGRPEDVAVYLPQSYNFAGSVLIVPVKNVQFIDADSSDVMTFIVSGGVTGLLKEKSEI